MSTLTTIKLESWDRLSKERKEIFVKHIENLSKELRKCFDKDMTGNEILEHISKKYGCKIETSLTYRIREALFGTRPKDQTLEQWSMKNIGSLTSRRRPYKIENAILLMILSLWFLFIVFLITKVLW